MAEIVIPGTKDQLPPPEAVGEFKPLLSKVPDNTIVNLDDTTIVYVGRWQSKMADTGLRDIIVFQDSVPPVLGKVTLTAHGENDLTVGQLERPTIPQVRALADGLDDIESPLFRGVQAAARVLIHQEAASIQRRHGVLYERTAKLNAALRHINLDLGQKK
jgi:hypothetical protein